MHPTGPLLDPKALARLHGLQVTARIVVDGLNAGGHRSPHKGHSVDFADHRPYVPGDDIRHVDWKVLARSDRLVLKRFEAETDLACTLAVDGSGSMAYRGDRAAVSKYRYASIVAATIAYLALEQQDRVGLTLFHEKAKVELHPSRQGQFDRVCHALEEHRPDAGTDALKSLEHLFAPATGRGLVVLISDLMAEPADLERTVDRLRHRGHDLSVLWVLDPDEADLGLDTISRLEGLEGEGEVVVEPRALRTAYAEQVAAHRMAVQTLCRRRRVALVECLTTDPYQVPLNRLLVELNQAAR